MRLVAPIQKVVRFLLNPSFDIESMKLVGHDGETHELPTLRFVPPFPKTPAINPALNVPDPASGQVGPAFAVGAQGAIGLQAVDVVLTSAQILALQTGAITLISAPGVGFHIVPHYVKMIFTGGSVAYTDAGGAVSFAVGSQAVALASNAIFLVTVTPNRRIQNLAVLAAAVGVGVTGTAANPPTEDAAPLTIAKITNNFAAGNGTMKLTIYYTIEPTV